MLALDGGLEAITFDIDLENRDAVQQATDGGEDHGLLGEDGVPMSERLVGGDEQGLMQAHYEADLARRQYDAVDSANRLVAGEQEHRWNERLEEGCDHEERLATIKAEHPGHLPSEEKKRRMALGDDLVDAWRHPDAAAATRKHILRTVFKGIMVALAGHRIDLLLHWPGKIAQDQCVILDGGIATELPRLGSTELELSDESQCAFGEPDSGIPQLAPSLSGSR